MRRAFFCIVLIVVPVAAQANPVEWFLTTNGWGWSNGYHANSDCVNAGTKHRPQWTPQGNPTYSAPQGPPGMGYQQAPVYQPQYQPQPTLAPPLPRETSPMETVPAPPKAGSRMMPPPEARAPGYPLMRY